MKRCAYKVLSGDLEGRGLGKYGRIILKCNLKSGVVGYELDSSSSGYGSVADCCTHGNEPSGFLNGENFLAS